MLDLQAEISGPITGAVLGLRRMLCISAAFRAFLSVDSEEAAAARCHLFDFDREPATMARMRPFAVVWPADQLDLEQYAGGDQNFLKAGGQLVLVLTDNDHFPRDPSQSGIDFAAKLDRILTDLSAMAGRSDYLGVRRIALHRRITHSPAKDQGVDGAGYWHVGFLVEWR